MGMTGCGMIEFSPSTVPVSLQCSIPGSMAHPMQSNISEFRKGGIVHGKK
jgi:hypothetical protein